MTEQTLDLIIISDAKNDYLKFLTEQSIRTAKENESNVSVRVYVIERQSVLHDGATTSYVSEKINYNRFLNIGASFGKSDYIFFANNDLIFHKDWATNLIGGMIANNANSASPYCHTSHNNPPTGILPYSGFYEGYGIRREFACWAFCLTRELWDRMPLDERVEFWCSDNAVTEQLKSLGEKHILVTDSIVEHIGNGSNTLKQTPIQETAHLLHPQVKKFNRLYDTNLWNLGKD